jgi:hypothetical protein
MLGVLSISRLLKKESGLRIWVRMLMMVAWVPIETVTCMKIEAKRFTAIMLVWFWKNTY